jgi:8-oxo-dGTP diphosphatase
MMPVRAGPGKNTSSATAGWSSYPVMLPLIPVAAGVLADNDGRVLIARRPPGRHGAGFWEFPGGKIAPGETAEQALGRELQEEIGVTVERAEPIMTLRHAYPDRLVELHCWRVLEWIGEPRGLEGQSLQWLPPDQLMAAGLLPADEPLVAALLPR